MYLSSGLRFLLGVALFTLLGPVIGMVGWVIVMLFNQTPAEALQFFALAGLFAALLPAFISGLLLYHCHYWFLKVPRADSSRRIGCNRCFYGSAIGLGYFQRIWLRSLVLT